MQVKNLTKYPKIFDCYWGEAEDTDIENIDDLIKNRNEFKEREKLVKYMDNYGTFLGGLFDHSELYKSADGYVLIVSPYCGHEPYGESLAIEANWLGFEECPPLYYGNSRTFIKRFRDKWTYNRFMKAEYNKCGHSWRP